MTVQEFIAAEVLKPFEPGQTDCCKTVDRWLERVKGYSLLRRFGMDYHDAAGMARLSAAHQNMLFAMIAVAEKDGGVETEAPVAGDVGVIVTKTGHVCAAIHAGSYWFSRHETGLIGEPVGEARVLKAWAVIHA